MGSWSAAQRLFEEVIAGMTAQYGPTYTKTLMAKSNLAIQIQAQPDGGVRAEAWRLFEEVIAGHTAELGPTHTDTLRTKGNLATMLRNMDKQAEARRLYEEK